MRAAMSALPKVCWNCSFIALASVNIKVDRISVVFCREPRDWGEGGSVYEDNELIDLY